MKKNKIWYLVVCVFLILGCDQKTMNIEDFEANVVVDWNALVIKMAIAEDNLLTLKGVRTLSMMHLAMHDALNSSVSKYESYAYQDRHTNVDPIIATSYAAYTVAVNSYPDKKNEFQELLDAYLKQENTSKNSQAKVLGVAAANAVIEKRKNDAWDGQSSYTWHPMAPGVYAEFNEHSGTPEGFVFGSGWAIAKPFMLPKQDHFRAPPPPVITSNAYTKAFNEVKEFGGFESKKRTQDQTHLALWWKEFVESSHNQLLRDLVEKEQPNLWEATRSFAMMNMAIYDAYINVFDNKFHYNHWRPYTAIRWAANDENPETKEDVNWNNLHNS